MARRFGYSRVSTSDQDWSLQLEALTKAGVDDRGRARTCNLRVRSPMLYPLSYAARLGAEPPPTKLLFGTQSRLVQACSGSPGRASP